jgi:hypothetical protein
MGLTALLPLQKKSCYRFLLPLKIHPPWLHLNPRILGPMASMLITRPPRATTTKLGTHPNQGERLCCEKGNITEQNVLLYDLFISQRLQHLHVLDN